MQQPGWYLKRLRRMSGAEMAYRLARTVRTVSTPLMRRVAPARDAFATDLRLMCWLLLEVMDPEDFLGHP